MLRTVERPGRASREEFRGFAERFADDDGFLRLLGNEARHLARRASQRQQPEAPKPRVRRSVEVRAPLTKKGPSLGALERLYRVSRSRR